MGASVLTFGTQRFSPLAHDPPGARCCQQAGLVNPSLQLFYLALATEHAARGAESKRWRRDFVLALEKRRAKRQARLWAKTETQSLMPSALFKLGAR